MSVGVLGRPDELEAIERTLRQLDSGPAILVLQGEPGIGKTTLIRAGGDVARSRGARVLVCAGSPSEARLSYSGLSDLMAEVHDDELDGLPAPQRAALRRAVLRADCDGASDVDRRAVAAGSVSLLTQLGARRPTLVTVDDWQWLDRASASVIEYCLRRLPAGIGLLIAERNGSPASWHRLFDSLSDSYRHGLWQIGPLGRNHIERLIRDRLGNEVRSSLLSRACEASGGNPFYAIELARDLPRNRSNGSSLVLPPSLAELVHDQFDGLDAGIKELLLAVAMLAHPTIPRLLQALGSDVAAQVATAEDRNILVVVGDRVAFTHPLLAHAAHVIATPSSRRAMHQRLSRLVTDPEERARHLAEGGVLPEALSALEEAARRARARGAPEVAAELTERALELGADRSYLVRAAELFYDAGRSIEAEALLEEAVATLEAGRYRAEALLLLSEIRYTDDSFPEAQRLLERARSEVDGDDRLLAMIDLRRSNVSFNLGHFGLAASAARSATTSADRVAEAGLLAQSMAASVIVDLTLGCGVDEPRLRTALELEDEDLRTGAEFSPAVIGAFVYLWTDRLDESRDLLDSVCNRFADRGEEHALAWVSFIRVGLECGAGRLADALAAAETACTRLNLLDTTNAAALSLTARG
ncbi:MAG: AAA family ATPase [Acidobacteriota bacterium]|nr:AAA family ATPase [Acidobacteriota bacterium]